MNTAKITSAIAGIGYTLAFAGYALINGDFELAARISAALVVAGIFGALIHRAWAEPQSLLVFSGSASAFLKFGRSAEIVERLGYTWNPENHTWVNPTPGPDGTITSAMEIAGRCCALMSPDIAGGPKRWMFSNDGLGNFYAMCRELERDGSVVELIRGKNGQDIATWLRDHDHEYHTLDMLCEAIKKEFQ
jgi:hypothetical protein